MCAYHLGCLQAEEHLYYRSGQLVKLLRKWRGTTATIAGRFEELVIELYTRDYLELKVGCWKEFCGFKASCSRVGFPFVTCCWKVRH